MNSEFVFSGDWSAIKQRYEAWWKGENTDGPIMGVIAPRSAAVDRVADRWVESSAENADRKETHTPQKPTRDPAEFEKDWTDEARILQRNLAMFQGMYVCGDGYPRVSPSLGPAGLAAILGAKMRFAEDTVWYREFLEKAESAHLSFDPNNRWLQWSLKAGKWLKERENGRYITAIPELCEPFDVLAQLFDSQSFLMELYENPDGIKALLDIVQDAWLKTYDMYYDSFVGEDGFCCYGPFALLGKGKVAKIQCDMSAMLSPAMFEEFALSQLTELTQKLDKSLYHLDGREALRHLDLVLSMEELTALQWTPGAGHADGGDECWDFIYEKALDAGKRIYALVHPKNLQRFVKRFGGKGVYIVTQATGPEMADQLVSMTKVLSAGR